MQYMKKTYVLSCCLCVWLIAGCSTFENKPIYSHQPKSAVSKNGAVQEAIIHTLYHQYAEWKGVRHKLGGLSKRGIDCSGFVYLTYKDRLGITLPRTTQQQSQYGKVIEKYELKTGDLVFFRTGRISKHVGIYLQNNTFLHVSQKKGVTISHLNNVYWNAKYWKSVRI